MAKRLENPEETRRRVPRRAYDGAVGVLLHGQYKMERAYQVGERGIMISGVGMGVGTQLVVNFFVNANVLITVRAVVRSVIPAQGNYPPRLGLEFLNLEFQFKREIRNFVAAATRSTGQVAS